MKDVVFEGNKFEGYDFAYSVAIYVDFYLEKGGEVELNDCELGSSTFNDESRVTFINCSSDNNTALPPIAFGETGFVGSIFGEDSLTMIVALLALIASGVAIFLVVYYNKKKVVPVAADTKEAEDEE
ncbi:MAG: hypothetical protein IKT70_01750 [Clostridia bacterium]|nr:hypothetical protein [Clostridia bacterium]